MARILLSAYACEPGRGSEPGVGWGWATELAELGHEVWVLTRADNRVTIARNSPVDPLNPKFIYYDLPSWLEGGESGLQPKRCITFCGSGARRNTFGSYFRRFRSIRYTTSPMSPYVFPASCLGWEVVSALARFREERAFLTAFAQGFQLAHSAENYCEISRTNWLLSIPSCGRSSGERKKSL